MVKARDDGTAPLEPPPSYDEAISSTNTPTNNYPVPGASSVHSNRPPAPRPSSQPSSSTRPSGTSTDNLYSTNPELPFKYPRGYFCNKCKNSGFKASNGKACSDCWNSFHKSQDGYNPNPKLPFKYPKRFICRKCNNTGYKIKNGRTCQDCWERFGPRNRYQEIPTSTPFGRFGVSDFLFGPQSQMQPLPMHGQNSTPIRVAPGDPRLGGILCGRCRGSGLVMFLLDEELCPVCSGLGRIVNVAPPMANIPPPTPYGNGPGYQQMPPQVPPNGGNYPQYMPPRKN